jgi:tol-pal system protein YbgF
MMTQSTRDFVFRAALVAVLALPSAGAAQAPAQGQTPSVEARLDRVERLLESQSLVDMLTRLEQLEKEIRQLRGDVELLSHNFEDLKRRQKDLYLDMDRRLRQLEVGATQAPVQPPVAPAPAPPESPTPGAPSPAPTAGAERAYQQAFNLLKDTRYQQAERAFREFLQTYPQSVYAGNAQYWMAETQYVTRNFESALGEFHKVVERYPDSSKVPDALLKIGFIHYELQQWDAARKALTEVRTRFPNSTAASLAVKRLQRMSLEGR